MPATCLWVCMWECVQMCHLLRGFPTHIFAGLCKCRGFQGGRYMQEGRIVCRGPHKLSFS